MRTFIVLALILSGCANYDTFVDGYAGFNDRGLGTAGGRYGAYLEGDKVVDGGFAIDAAGILGDEVDRIVLSPLLMTRIRAAQYLEPYLGAGPSLVYSDGAGRSLDVGATLLGGLAYRIGDLGGKPWWAFLEFRGSYVGDRGSRDSRESRSAASKRGRGPPCFPGDRRDGCQPGVDPEPPPPVTEPPRMPGPTSGLDDDWSVHVLLGVSIRW